MIADEFIIREASGADMPGIARVRTSVTENLLTTEQLAQRGITNASVAASLLVDRKGWVAERSGEIVAFSMADRADPSIFALFVLPRHDCVDGFDVQSCEYRVPTDEFAPDCAGRQGYGMRPVP